ncbi:MAG: peptidoglycan-binding domain-containing protein [Cyanobacteria bacterium P01_C01_bin.38]
MLNFNDKKYNQLNNQGNHMETFDKNSQRTEKNGKVKTFQQRVFSMEEDAVTNNLEQQVNQNLPIALPELKKGSKGEMVMKAQRILKTTSDYIGYVDGDFGWVMEAAVQSFQRRSKVTITGIINDDTWNALNQIRR